MGSVVLSPGSVSSLLLDVRQRSPLAPQPKRHPRRSYVSSTPLCPHSRLRGRRLRLQTLYAAQNGHVAPSFAENGNGAAAPQDLRAGARNSVAETFPGLKPHKPKRAPLDSLYLTGLVQQESTHLAIALGSVLVCTICNLASPVLMGALFEALVQQKPAGEYAKLFWILAATYTVEPIFTKTYVENLLMAAEKVLATLRLELYRTLLMQKIEYFDKHNAAELTSLISVDLDNIRAFIFNNCTRDRGLRAMLEAAGSVLVLFSLSWRLAPVCTIIISACGVAAALYRKHTKEIESRQSRAVQRMNAVAFQALDNIRTVRSFAGEPLERERFHDHASRAYRAGRSFAGAKALFEAANRLSMHISILALYSWGGWLASQGLMPVGVLISGIGFTYSLMYAVQGTVNTLAEMRRASGAFHRVQAMVQTSDPDPSMYGALPPGAWWELANGGKLTLQPYTDKASEAAVKAAREGDLELKNVCFSYPVRPTVPVLEGIDMKLSRGTVTALVGRSGAGKSTVAALLSRFYDVQGGTITLGEHNINAFSRGEWCRAVAMVGQEPVLFSGTIADNIAYGKFGLASEEEIVAAAVAANAHEFIEGLPEKYQTMVGERGTLLSGGQRQRIAIARALLKDSPIIILDEATSALDVLSERLVQDAIQRLVVGRTVLVIAHRLSTVETADQILVLSGGKVVECGTHEALLATKGLYTELMSAQELILGST